MLNEKSQKEQGVWEAQSAVEFYRTHRNSTTGVYDSEKIFLPSILPEVNNVLDVGCAAGGFSEIMCAYNPAIQYTGVDIAPAMIEVARREHPQFDFQLSDGQHFPFPGNSFDLVFCSGVLHVNSYYQDMVKAMWEQTNRYLLCDFRLTRGPQIIGKIGVDSNDDPNNKPLPYLVVNLDQLMGFLNTLSPLPISIQARGYSHPPSSMADLPIDKVIMGFFLLEKGKNQTAGNLPVKIDLDFR